MTWNDETMAKAMQIRYVKLHFELEMLEDGRLPKNKASMMRGGMGRMLLMMNCVRDENCGACDFEEECLVRRIMYAPMKIRPSFMTQNDSEGYVIECEDREEEFAAGDVLEFQLVLFGNCIVYFNQFVQAFHALGMAGIGKERLRYRISRVTNTNRELLLEDGLFHKNRYRIRRVEEYVRYRIRAFEDNEEALIVFHTPLSLKYNGSFLNTFDSSALLAAAWRRLFIMNCYEGFREGEDYHRPDFEGHIPSKVDERVFREGQPRYSGTHDEKMLLRGIRGSCRLSDVDRTAMALLLAGELLHIGKNTSFGFGRYTVKNVREE
jgi:hypothetical protein